MTALDPFVHHHQRQTEVLSLKAGELVLTVDGEESASSAGDQVTLPPGTRHSLVNRGEGDAEMEVGYHPALKSEWWLSTFHGAAERLGQDPGPLDLLPHLVVKDVGVRPADIPGWALVGLGWAPYPLARLTGRWTRLAELALSEPTGR